MRRRFNFSYVIIPLVYVGLIFSLVLLQFSGGKLFNANIGPISLSGAFTMQGGTEQKQIASLSVQVQGLRFVFDRDHDLLIQNQDDTFTPLRLTGYESTPQSLTLNFERGASMVFQYTDGKGGAVTAGVELPAALSPLKSIRIPYAPAGGATLAVNRAGANLEISWQGGAYTAVLPTRSFADEAKGLIVIPGEGSRTIRVAAKAAGPKNIIEDIQVPTVAQKDFEDGLKAFVDASYAGWKTGRFNSSNGTWAFRDGENRFNEDTMVALLSEAWRRDEYTCVYNEMRTTADQHPAQLSWKSSVFIGNLKRVTNELATIDRTESARLASLVAQKNPDVYLKPDLFKFALDRGSKDLAPSLIQFTEELATESLSPVQALGALQNLYLADLPDPAAANALARFESLIKTSLIPAVIHVDEGFFFQVKPEKGDGYYTVLAGRILEKAGEKNGDERLVALGRNMVLSVLKLADDAGFVPNQIDFSAGAISAMLKYKSPEDFYWLVNNNPYYPREVSLYSQLGPGHWFYTLAVVNSVSIKPNEFRFNLSYPRSRMHYIFFRGLDPIDPLTGMQLFGITWRNASDFDNYSKGRFYNADTRTLMVKYYDDSVQRDIVVWYK